MTGTVAAMDVRMAAAMVGAVGNVAAFCERQNISRTTYYKWQKRFADGGVEGLAERSRQPRSSPTATCLDLEERIVGLRKELADQGKDHGPDPIRWALLGAGVAMVPSRATVARILGRRGLVVAAPQKRPKSSLHRFVFPRPNDCWQSDFTHYPLTDGTGTAIAGSLDDNSRTLAGIGAGVGEGSSELVWSVMVEAIGSFGVPAMSLTDNGIVYSGARRGTEVAFEVNLRALGCQPICSTPRHPQTCGKIERFWQTLKKWLDANGPFDTLEALQTALTVFQSYYNQQRPHRALQGATPAEVFAAGELARPASRPLAAPVLVYRSEVHANGTVDAGTYRVNVGVAWARQQVTTVKDGDHIAIFKGNRLIRELDADPTRTYQGAEPARRPRPAQ